MTESPVCKVCGEATHLMWEVCIDAKTKWWCSEHATTAGFAPPVSDEMPFVKMSWAAMGIGTCDACAEDDRRVVMEWYVVGGRRAEWQNCDECNAQHGSPGMLVQRAGWMSLRVVT